MFPLYAGLLLILCTSFIFGCESARNKETKVKVMYLTEVLKSDLMNVNRIDVRFGDGNKIEMTDPITIQDIVSKLKSIEVRETKSKGVGSLFYLELKEADKMYRLGNEFIFNGKTYETIGENAKKLNEAIIKLGRDQIPGLLPGVNAG